MQVDQGAIEVLTRGVLSAVTQTTHVGCQMEYHVRAGNGSLRVVGVAEVALSAARRTNLVARHFTCFGQSPDHCRSNESASTGHNDSLTAPERGTHSASTTASQHGVSTQRGFPRTNGSFRVVLLPMNIAGTN